MKLVPGQGVCGLGLLMREELRMGISRSPRRKRIERVVHFGIEIWVSSEKILRQLRHRRWGRWPVLYQDLRSSLTSAWEAGSHEAEALLAAVTSSRGSSPPGHAALRQPAAPPGCLGSFEVSSGRSDAVEADPKPCSFRLCLVGTCSGVTPRLCF